MVQIAIIRIDVHLVRSWLVCLCLCSSCVSNSLASVDVCQEPEADPHLSIAYYKHGESSIERNLGESRQENVDIDLQLKSNNKWTFGAGYRYTILNVDRLELQTNGHLHTFFLPVHRLSQADRKIANSWLGSASTIVSSAWIARPYCPNDSN